MKPEQISHITILNEGYVAIRGSPDSFNLYNSNFKLVSKH